MGLGVERGHGGFPGLKAQLMRRFGEFNRSGRNPRMNTRQTDLRATGSDRASTASTCRILRVLQADGRISNLKLAEEVHLSPTAVLERVKRLTRDGYILGYEARLNPLKARRRAAGVRGGAAGPHRARRDGQLQGRRAGAPRDPGSHLVAGGFDYLLKTRVADMAAYRQFIGSVIWTLPGVRETRTYAVMEEVNDPGDGRSQRSVQSPGRLHPHQ
jgi:Lrp/AsnC family leucine-responsive transcriptional regulator